MGSTVGSPGVVGSLGAATSTYQLVGNPSSFKVEGNQLVTTTQLPPGRYTVTVEVTENGITTKKEYTITVEGSQQNENDAIDVLFERLSTGEATLFGAYEWAVAPSHAVDADAGDADASAVAVAVADDSPTE
jgi:hypothetical protein